MRPVLTAGCFDGVEPFSVERLRRGRKGPVYHAGKPVDVRPVWKDDYGAFRRGRTGDMVQMMTDLGVSDRAF